MTLAAQPPSIRRAFELHGVTFDAGSLRLFERRLAA